jgi:flagellar biosynthesis anti-sigma factor FlgM
MKISANPVTFRDLMLRSAAGTKKTSYFGIGASPSGRDSVTISDDAIRFSRAFQQAHETAAVRTDEELERIAGIKSALARGEYRVDSLAIADSILSGRML